MLFGPFIDLNGPKHRGIGDHLAGLRVIGFICFVAGTVALFLSSPEEWETEKINIIKINRKLFFISWVVSVVMVIIQQVELPHFLVTGNNGREDHNFVYWSNSIFHVGLALLFSAIEKGKIKWSKGKFISSESSDELTQD